MSLRTHCLQFTVRLKIFPAADLKFQILLIRSKYNENIDQTILSPAGIRLLASSMLNFQLFSLIVAGQYVIANTQE